MALVYLATKVGDILIAKIQEKIEDEILKSMGETKVKLEDLSAKMDGLRGDQAKVAAQITLLSNEVRMLNKEQAASEAAGQIKHFFEAYTRELAISKKNNTTTALEEIKKDLRSTTSGIENQLVRFHDAMVGNHSLFSLTAAIIEYYWGEHENNNSQEGLKFGIVALADKIRGFIASTAHIQSTAIYLVGEIYDEERTKLIVNKASQYMREQAQLLIKLLPPSIDLKKEQVDDFLIGPHFYLEVQNAPDKRKWLSSVYTKYETFADSAFSPGYTRSYIFPYVWNLGDEEKVRARWGYHWTIERAPGDTGFYILSGYNRRSGFGEPQQVNIRWEQGQDEKEFDHKEGKRPRYATRWEGDVVSFKIIMVKSKMKDYNDSLRQQPRGTPTRTPENNTAAGVVEGLDASYLTPTASLKHTL